MYVELNMEHQLAWLVDLFWIQDVNFDADVRFWEWEIFLWINEKFLLLF